MQIRSCGQTNKQTDKQTNTAKNITLLVELSNNNIKAGTVTHSKRTATAFVLFLLKKNCAAPLHEIKSLELYALIYTSHGIIGLKCIDILYLNDFISHTYKPFEHTNFKKTIGIINANLN